MNKAKLIAHIVNPSTLFNTSYEELKTMSIQYPYNANLKYLLLSKARMENNHEVDRNLHIAAMYSIDRAYLRRLMSKKVTAKDTAELLNEDEVLELRDTKTLAWDIEQLKGGGLPNVPSSTSDDLISASIASESFPRKGKTVKKQKAPTVTDPQKQVVQDEILQKINLLNKKIESLDLSVPEDLNRLNQLTEEVRQLIEKKSPSKMPIIAEPEIEQVVKVKKVSAGKKKKKPAKKKDLSAAKEKEVTRIAGKSVEKNESMVSETLALILEKQGLFQEAIEMYEQLILTFPKKKAFFAAKIKNLKK